MPRGERSTPPPEAIEQGLLDSLDKKLGKKAPQEIETFGSPFEALVDKIAKRQAETDPKKQAELDGDIAADVSFLAEKAPETMEDTEELQIGDLKKQLKGSRGGTRTELKAKIAAMEEAVERIRGQRLAEIPEPPTAETFDESAESQETDRLIAQEQRTVLDTVDRGLMKSIADPELKVGETRMVSGLRKKLNALRKAYDAGTLPPKDFVTDSALLFADIQEKTDVLQKDIAERSESREEIAGIFREVKRSQDVVGDAGMRQAPEPAGPSEADEEVRDRIAEARLAPPPENLPVELDENDVEDITDEPQPIPLTARKEEPIPLEVRKADAEEIAPDTETAQVDAEYRNEAQAQAAIQEKTDYFLTLDAEGREEMQAEVQSQLKNGEGSLDYAGWSREDLYRLNKNIEGMRAKPEQVQRGERERMDRAEQTLPRLKKQVEKMMRETPNAAELMRVHTGSGWETLSAESFANRYLTLLNKDIAYTQAKKSTSFFGKVGRLFGRKGPEADIMSSAERSEFKQMDAIMEELGIEKSTYTTASPSIREY